MPDERTPLLVEAGRHVNNNDPPDTRSASASSSTLHDSAVVLIGQIRSGEPPSRTSGYLPSLLYALSLTTLPNTSIGLLLTREPYDAWHLGARTSVRARMSQEVQMRKVQVWLSDEIETVLDRWVDQDDLEGMDDEAEDEVEVMLWKKWNVDGREKEVCVIDLLLPQYTPTFPSPFLSHPLIRQVLDHTWRNGSARVVTPDGVVSLSTMTRLKWRLHSAITLQRTHLLHFVSFFVLFSLTLVLSLQPRGRITPYDLPPSRLGGVEVVYAMWTFSAFLDSLSHLSIRTVLLLPSLTCVVLAFASLHTWSFTFLTLSIPTITISLVLPYYPALPILFPSLLPLSVLMLQILRRSVWTAGLVVPLAVGLFVVFAWAMNGDIFRGFYAIPIPHLPNHHRLNQSNHPTNQSIHLTSPTPVEPDIAPFQTRIWLFVTFTILILLAIILGITRALMPNRQIWDEPNMKRWKGAIKENDEWEAEYGVVVGRSARRAWAESVKKGFGLDGVRIPPPCNALLVPLDIAIYTTKLLTSCRSPEQSSKIQQILVEIREWFVVILLGPPCLLLGVLDRY